MQLYFLCTPYGQKKKNEKQSRFHYKKKDDMKILNHKSKSKSKKKKLATEKKDIFELLLSNRRLHKNGKTTTILVQNL